jgi:hypothetical protein
MSYKFLVGFENIFKFRNKNFQYTIKIVFILLCLATDAEMKFDCNNQKIITNKCFAFNF